MRIISGRFKGRQIQFLKSLTTRPLKDSVKENIFNILTHSNKIKTKVENANILDLYSGVGSFGIECISRGAENVVFIENYRNVLTVLKKNLTNLKSISNYQIIENDIYDEKVYSNLNNNFNIIFLDPPYKDKNYVSVLLKIKEKNLLAPNGIIIIHRHKDESDNLSLNFKILEEKKYGISKILFLTF